MFFSFVILHVFPQLVLHNFNLPLEFPPLSLHVFVVLWQLWHMFAKLCTVQCADAFGPDQPKTKTKTDETRKIFFYFFCIYFLFCLSSQVNFVCSFVALEAK